MSSYVYDPLSPGSILLLRLSPSQDEQAPIHCHLFPYPLSSWRTGTHLYEALSYYWGSPEKTHTITVGDGSLQITRNLHTALQSLRDCLIERIMWIDAICINQDDAEEKGRQVQLMAEIYAKASRVVVWLENTTGDPEIDDEAYNDSAQALEIIGSCAMGSQNESTDEEVRDQTVAKLLGRAWFRRVWVLQEAAAARHILIKCRLAEIDGYAFCLGLEEMDMDFMDRETHVRIRSTLYLIRAATLRPKRVDSTTARFSLQIWPLMVLVEMYYVREATDRRDKVYALLGMSIEMPTGIVPDYRISWSELFSRLVRSAIHDCISVDTWDKYETAVIRSKGYVVGIVRWTQPENDWRAQHVTVDICVSGSEARHNWYFQAAAKSIQANDVVCFLQGASLPTIVRVHEDYCDIIAIAVNPTLNEDGDYIATHLKDLSSQKAEHPVEFLLVWSWDVSSGRAEETLSFDSCMIQNGLHCSAPSKSDRLMNVGYLYRALGSDKEAILPFSTIVKLYENSSQRNHPASLAAIDALVEIYKADNSPAGKDKAEGWEMMSNLLHQREGFVVMNEDLISRVASNPDAGVMKFVLHTYAEQITITDSILAAAAANGRSGKNIMELLLDFQDEVTISENILAAAAANRELGKAIITLCFERKQDQIVITESVVEAAASTETTFFLLGLGNFYLPINRGIYILFTSDLETYSHKPDIPPKDTLRLVASFLERQTAKIVIDARLIRSVLNVDSQPHISDWGMANHEKGKNMEVAQHHIEEDVLAMMLGWEGSGVVVTQGAIQEMAKFGLHKEMTLRTLGNELLHELT